MKRGITRCDMCHAEVEIPGNISEKTIQANLSTGEEKDLILTVLNCPFCGKESIVQIDDDYTQSILSQVKELYLKRARFNSLGKNPPSKLSYKIGKLDSKLSHERSKLAKELDGAFYQVEGNIIQLDYRYHAR